MARLGWRSLVGALVPRKVGVCGRASNSSPIHLHWLLGAGSRDATVPGSGHYRRVRRQVRTRPVFSDEAGFGSVCRSPRLRPDDLGRVAKATAEFMPVQNAQQIRDSDTDLAVKTRVSDRTSLRSSTYQVNLKLLCRFTTTIGRHTWSRS